MTDPVSPVPAPERADAGGRRPFWKHPLFKRLPLLLVALVGFWLWHSSGHERQLIWQLPPERRVSISRMEVQLRDPQGEILKREEFDFPEGAPAEVIQKARLKEGTYEAWVFLTPKSGGPTITLKQPVQVEDDTVIERLP